ncbi:MAG: hypothetical protein R3C20_09050 [Planctomycetaceae bacterium]
MAPRKLAMSHCSNPGRAKSRLLRHQYFARVFSARGMARCQRLMMTDDILTISEHVHPAVALARSAAQAAYHVLR